MKLLLLIAILISAENSFSQLNNKTNIKVTMLEFDEDSELEDSSFFYIKSISELTFELLNEHLYRSVRIPDSLRNKSCSADTLILKSNVGNKNYESIVSKVYNKLGFLSEYYNSSCIACGNQPSRYYLIYAQNRLVTMIHDNLMSNTRQIYEFAYDPKNSINRIVIYKEYHTKNLNSFSNIFGNPNFADDIEYSERKIERRILLRYK